MHTVVDTGMYRNTINGQPLWYKHTQMGTDRGVRIFKIRIPVDNGQLKSITCNSYLFGRNIDHVRSHTHKFCPSLTHTKRQETAQVSTISSMLVLSIL